MPSKFPISTLLAAATFAGILLEVHYAVDRSKGLDPATLKPVLAFRTDRSAIIPVVALPLPGVPTALSVPNPKSPGFSSASAANLTLESQFLLDGYGVLDRFYASLHALEDGQRDHPVRIIHYGDSPTTADLITGDARELLQDKFGDAGPGFNLIAKPWAWYGHRGVDITASGWKMATAVDATREGSFGLGGVLFTGPVGAESTFHLQAKTATSLEVQYLETPGSGTLEVSADGKSIATLKTAGDSKTSASQTLDLPEGTRQVTLRVADATVQAFGVVFATSHNGLVYDSIGLNGASTAAMSRAFSPVIWGEALRQRNPDLVIVNYGTNESGSLLYIDKYYEIELRRAIARVRAALPNASILIMSPMDRGEKAGGEIATMPGIQHIVAIQQRVSAELGCGFFNTFQAMGGEGTMERWYDGHPRMVSADYIHPTPQGARIVAQLLTSQLLIGYERYLQHHLQTKKPDSPKIAGASNQPDTAPVSKPVPTPAPEPDKLKGVP